jgi:hypothetical protein
MNDQIRTLARAAFSSFFQSELMLQGLPQVRLVIFVAVLVMIPAINLPMSVWGGYHRASLIDPVSLPLLMWPHKLLFVTFAMVATALVSLVIWDNVFPDRRDAYVIGHLPVRSSTVIVARLLAVGALMLLIALGSSLPSAFTYGVVAGGYSRGGILRTMFGHFFATLGASVFAFLLLLGVQGVLLNVVAGRWVQRLMLALQFVFVVASLEALLFMAPVTRAVERAARAGELAAWAQWAPPVWFLGFYEALAGGLWPIPGSASRAMASLALLLPIAFGLYALTYARLMRRAVEAENSERLAGINIFSAAATWLSRVLTRSPIAETVCRFSLVTLARSRKHRMLLTIFAGVGTTIATTGVLLPLTRRGAQFNPWQPDPPLLSFSIILVFFLVVGFRFLFAIPVDPPGNWIFRLADADDAKYHVRGARAALIVGGILPVLVLLLPLHAVLWGPAAAAAHSVFLFAAGALLADIVLVGFQKVPFTCPYSPPISRVRLMWPLGLVAFTTFSYTMAAIEAVALRAPKVYGVVLVLMIAGRIVISRWRESLVPQAPALMFEEEEEDSLTTLQLGSIRSDGVLPS